MIYDTSILTPAGTGDPFLDYQIYNGLDNCITYEVHERLSTFQGNELIYSFERAMQAPALEMMLRGLRVDRLAVDSAVRHLRGQLEILQDLLNRYGEAVWDKPLNPRSSLQLKTLFYEVMKLPVQYKLQKGKRTPSADRDSLEKLENYFHAKPICKAILAFRDIAKQIEFLCTSVDADGRIRTSYNVAGTETGRWSSSANAFGTGTNLQNFPDKLRSIFIADEGKKFAYCDLEQAESWIVGIRSWLVSGDRSYLTAIQSGDLHTTVAKLIWPNLPWVGNLRDDRLIAERPFYRDYSYRDMAKRGGHGTNYYGTAPTMARHLKIPTAMMQEFQDAYFRAFPGIGGSFNTNTWHRWVGERLQLEGQLTTMLGRTRHFFGRLSDDATLREAIAFEPQSVVGDLLNLGAWRIWSRGDKSDVRLLAQLHDAVLIDFPEDQDSSTKPIIESLMRTELHEGGETFVIPNDFSSGWNWGKFNDDPKRGPINLPGVRKWKGEETRKRPSMRGLDRVIPSFH
jgi:DNA polymerase-1